MEDLDSWGYVEAREHLHIETRPDGVFRIDRRTGAAERLAEPQVAGWSPAGGLHSIRPDNAPDTLDAIDARIPIRPEAEAEEALADDHFSKAAKRYRDAFRKVEGL
jgi:hypothetical protein